ncbi:endonuclease domain-containing protein [Micromonospora fluostatini]|uniref:endonuclease domain-containing protein n=1 Tax=Micromonospora sp. JCM 30529 TaxID=3421643 RepID=UPI003D17C57E
MPPRAQRPRSLAFQVFRGSEAVRCGLLTKHQLRSSAWLRVRHDVYADARLDRDHTLACRAVALRLPATVLLAGPSAAYLHGVEHAASFADDVHVLTTGSVRVAAQHGVRVHTSQSDAVPAPAVAFRSPTTDRAGPVPAGLILAGSPAGPTGDGPPAGLILDGSPAGLGGDGPPAGLIQVGPPARSGPAEAAWETAAWLEPAHAVGIIDTLLRRGLTDHAALDAVLTERAGQPGSRRAGLAFGLADPAAQSPPESHLRVRLVLSGLPRPVAQHPIRLPSGRLLHVDLAWPGFRVAVECAGPGPVDHEQLHRDRERRRQLAAVGWLVLHVTARRLHRDLSGVLREVHAALTAGGWQRPRSR